MNPTSFSDLPKEVRRELGFYTQMARNRLLEQESTPADRKKAFLKGEKRDRPPFLLVDYPVRLIGANRLSYHTDTVTHYKAYCAGIARFGVELLFAATVTWHNRIVERLGGEVSYMPGKSPEPKVWPFSTMEDLENAQAINFDLCN